MPRGRANGWWKKRGTARVRASTDIRIDVMPLIMGRAPGNNKPLFGNTQISWTQFGELQVIRDVPNISLNIGQTHSMTQYMLDPGNLRVSTAVLENGVPLSGATLNIISYDSGTELLTAVGPGTVGQLQLQVTY